MVTGAGTVLVAVAVGLLACPAAAGVKEELSFVRRNHSLRREVDQHETTSLRRFRRDMGRPEVGVSPEALDIMMNYDWPGNVRELQNWLQFALVKCRSEEIMPEHLPPPRPGQRRSYVRSSRRGRRGLTIESVRDALTRAEGNRVETAKLLGVSRATLYRFFSDHAEEL